MRCRACDVILSDYETTRKSLVTGEYYDLCNNCFKTIKSDLVYKDRLDLASSNDLYEIVNEEDDDEFGNIEY